MFLLKYYRHILGSILGIIVLFLIAALIPRKWGKYSSQGCNYQVCVANTGAHSNILVRTKNDAQNWHNYLSVDKIGIDAAKDYKYLSFGWGDKDFYMTVTSLSDFNFYTTFKAVFIPTSSVIYVKGYQSLPKNIEVKCILTNKTNYLQLIKFIKTNFQLDKNGNKIRIGNGHTTNAGFYKAKDTYSILRNCNTWTADGLRKADINTPLWDGLSSAILFHLKSGCEAEERNNFL
ncbi:MAG: DUF2459 domain-containing protein [Cyanobacteria bacterium P01_A01_bin.45]